MTFHKTMSVRKSEVNIRTYRVMKNENATYHGFIGNYKYFNELINL